LDGGAEAIEQEGLKWAKEKWKKRTPVEGLWKSTEKKKKERKKVLAEATAVD